jgi:hypothetical protein
VYWIAKCNYKAVFQGIIVILSIFNVYSGVNNVISSVYSNFIVKNEILRLREKITGKEDQYFFLVGNIEPIENIYYYYKNNDFGKQKLNMAGIALSSRETEIDNKQINIAAKKQETNVALCTQNEDDYLLLHPDFQEAITLISQEMSQNGRGFKKILFKIQKRYVSKNMVYFNGNTWEIL